MAGEHLCRRASTCTGRSRRPWRGAGSHAGTRRAVCTITYLAGMFAVICLTDRVFFFFVCLNCPQGLSVCLYEEKSCSLILRAPFHASILCALLVASSSQPVLLCFCSKRHRAFRGPLRSMRSHYPCSRSESAFYAAYQFHCRCRVKDLESKLRQKQRMIETLESGLESRDKQLADQVTSL